MKLQTVMTRYWRESALVIAIVLPWVALLPLGLLWLWQQAAAIWWVTGAALLGVAAFALPLSIARNTKAEAETTVEAARPASPEWGPHERGAWLLVEQICSRIEPLSFADPLPIRKVLDSTISALATHFHPGVPYAHLEMSIPEALLLTERLARELRSATLTYLPGVREIRIGRVFWGKTLYDRYSPLVKNVYPYLDRARRLIRFVGNPKTGFFGEVTKVLLGEVGGFLSYRVRAELTNLLIRETGRAAIDLYSGRLRLASDEVAAAASAENGGAKHDLVGPVRILIAGQVNAGKSSLVNAMAGQVQRSVGATPTSDGAAEIILELAGKPAVVLIDTPSMGNGSSASKILCDKARSADLILWVVSATQPARAPDYQTLRAIREAKGEVPHRRSPPILCAVTHVDELSPASEWAPPYDLDDPARPKARRIREALEHIADDLGFDRGIIPVCVRDLQDVYNLDLLWNLVAANLDDARFVKLDRLQKRQQGVSAREVLAQMTSAGRWLATAAWRGGAAVG